MQIPKHLTQVGMIPEGKKVFIEDYCISYVKQLVRDKPYEKKQIALYGMNEGEGDDEVIFVLGAAMVSEGSTCCEKLSVHEMKKIEEKQMEFFHGLKFVGFMVCEDSYQEKLYVVEKENKGILLEGFYIFYDKNESMLNFMMTEQKIERELDMDPVIVKKAEKDRIRKEKEKPEIVTVEGSYRKQLLAERKESPEFAQKRDVKKGNFPVVACCLLLAIGGAYSFKESYTSLNFAGVENFVNNLIADYVLADDVVERDTEIVAQADAEVFEEATEGVTGISAENSTEDHVEDVVQEGPEAQLEVEETIMLPEGLSEVVIPNPDEIEQENTTLEETTEIPMEDLAEVSAEVPTVELDTITSYQIKKGDNLLKILRAYYGEDSKLQEVCNLNNILEPDNIQVGQTILLP